MRDSIAIAMAAALAIPILAAPGIQAGATSISNEVSVLAESGHESGQATTGSASASVSVTNTVNGQTIATTSIRIETSGGTESVTQRIATSSAGGESTIETSVHVSAHSTVLPEKNSGASVSVPEAVSSPPLFTAAGGVEADVAPWWDEFLSAFLNFIRHAFGFV